MKEEAVLTEWQPIETAPRGVDILAVDLKHQRRVVRYAEGWEYWRTIPGNWLFRPTHWMPLPEPPHAD